MSNDTNFELTISAPSREQLEHALAFLVFKKERWESWKARGLDAEMLIARTGASNPAAIISWGFDLEGEITVGLDGTANVKASAFANQNSLGNVWISGENGELADLRKRFKFLKITGTYSNEYGEEGEI